MNNTITIIIPVYNEERHLLRILSFLNPYLKNKKLKEVIVVDDGSNDRTNYIKKRFPEIIFLNAKKGRAIQMNKGAEYASGSILYFLHVDSTLSENFDRLIKKTFAYYKAGCFRLKFMSKHPLLNISAWFTRFNFLICRGGDQSLYICKSLFSKIGKFDESYKIFEDIEIIRRIKKYTYFKIMPAYISTSSRLFYKNGVLKTLLNSIILYLLFFLNFPKKTLFSFYSSNFITSINKKINLL